MGPKEWPKSLVTLTLGTVSRYVFFGVQENMSCFLFISACHSWSVSSENFSLLALCLHDLFNVSVKEPIQ